MLSFSENIICFEGGEVMQIYLFLLKKNVVFHCLLLFLFLIKIFLQFVTAWCFCVLGIIIFAAVKVSCVCFQLQKMKVFKRHKISGKNFIWFWFIIFMGKLIYTEYSTNSIQVNPDHSVSKFWNLSKVLHQKLRGTSFRKHG